MCKWCTAMALVKLVLWLCCFIITELCTVLNTEHLMVGVMVLRLCGCPGVGGPVHQGSLWTGWEDVHLERRWPSLITKNQDPYSQGILKIYFKISICLKYASSVWIMDHLFFIISSLYEKTNKQTTSWSGRETRTCAGKQDVCSPQFGLRFRFFLTMQLC